jgi:hypothetical protein
MSEQLVDVQMASEFQWAIDPGNIDPGNNVRHTLPAGRLVQCPVDVAAAAIVAGAGEQPAKSASPDVSVLVERHRTEFGQFDIPLVPGSMAIDGTLIVLEMQHLQGVGGGNV